MCNMCAAGTAGTGKPEENISDDFAAVMLDTINRGAISLMLSIGYRTGLFDIMSGMQPASAAEIADEARLNERYVREWLNAMVVSKVISYDADTGQYSLPEQHARFLCREYSDNMAPFAQYVALLGAVEDRIVQCFEQGGGVPYSCYPRFQTIMADESSQTVVAALVDHILPLVPGIFQRLEAGIDVLDVGCGKGRAMLYLARAFPQSRFHGIDISHEAMVDAQAAAEAQRLCNIRFEVQDAAAFDRPNAFDLITTFDAVHDQAAPTDVLRNIHRALRSDGTYLMQDIDTSSNVARNIGNPVAPLIYTISCMHCMSVSLAQGGAGLGAAWGTELAEKMLREAGFTSVRLERLAHDIQNCYFISRKD